MVGKNEDLSLGQKQRRCGKATALRLKELPETVHSTIQATRRGLSIQFGPYGIHQLFAAKFASWTTDKAAEQRPHALVLPCRVGHGLPVRAVAPFQAKLPQCVDAYASEIGCRRGRNRGLLYTIQRSLYIRRKLFAYVGTNGSSIDYLISIPIWAMSYACAAPTAARLATVADLLMVGNLAIHSHPPQMIPFTV